MIAIEYPYLPEGRTIKYVPITNTYMLRARAHAKQFRSNLTQPGAALVVNNGCVIGIGSIGDNPVHSKGCERVRLNMPTGQGYELCKGCHPENHSERQAVFNALRAGYDTEGAELYLWGHWWCCESCWRSMIEAGICEVILLRGSERLFNKSHPDNIIGRQFKN